MTTPAKADGRVRSASVPLYYSVYLVLRGKILEQAFELDKPMPNEMELGAAYGVSRITIRRALDELAIEGLVRRQQGRGTFACPPDVATHVDGSLGSGLIENLIAMGIETQVKVLDFRLAVPPAAIARALKLETGAKVQKVIRVRSHRGVAFSHLTTYVPEEIGRSYTKADLKEKPLLVLLERAGVTPTYADQTISAELADPDVAGTLGISVGEALLRITRVVRDVNDRPVEYLSALYRPDRYVYRMSMSREQGPKSMLWAPNSDPIDEAFDAGPKTA